MTLDEAIATVEAAGFNWAIMRGPSTAEFVAAATKGDYVGDELSGPGAAEAATAADALIEALKSAIKFEEYMKRQKVKE